MDLTVCQCYQWMSYGIFIVCGHNSHTKQKLLQPPASPHLYDKYRTLKQETEEKTQTGSRPWSPWTRYWELHLPRGEGCIFLCGGVVFKCNFPNSHHVVEAEVRSSPICGAAFLAAFQFSWHSIQTKLEKNNKSNLLTQCLCLPPRLLGI